MRSIGNPRGFGSRAGVAALTLATVASLAMAGVSAAQDEKTINVAIVGNPQMEDIASLTPELFTAADGHQRRVHDPRGADAARDRHA